MRRNMRHRLRSAAVAAGAVGFYCVGYAPHAMAQDAVELPELSVNDGSASAPSQAASDEPSFAPEPVAATKPPTTVSSEPRIGTNTTDITAEDLARINPNDLQDVFSGQPGIMVGSSLPASQKVFVNGIEETNLAVTVDGAMQNGKVFHHNATNFIDPSLLKAVRVDAGVAPADAGFGALAGSIAYETKDVVDLLDRDGMGGFVKTQFNTNGNVFTNNVAAYGLSNGFEILGSFNIGDGDEFEAGDGRIVEGTETKFWSGLGKVAYQAMSGDRFEISHERINDDAERPYRANFIMPPIGLEPRLRNYDIERQTTVFNYSDATPNGWWDPKVVIAYGTTDVATAETARGSGVVTPVSGEAETFNGKFENKFALGIGSVIAGVDFANTKSSMTYAGDDTREKSAVVGGYAQARLEPIDGSRVSFGGRVDHQTFTGVNGREWDDSGVSGNVSVEQDLIGEFLMAKAGASHVWAGVPLSEGFILNSAWDYGSGPASVEADNVTAGLVSRFEGWTVEGTVFRTQIDNARVPTWALPNRDFDVESEGYEIGVGYDWGHGFMRVAYANIDTTIDGQPADAWTGGYLTTPAGEMITVAAVHTFVGTGFTVGADAIIAPTYDRVAAGSDPFPSYKVFNAFVEYRPELPFDLALRMDVRNLFDEMYANRASYGQEWISDPLSPTTPLYEPGRSFIFTATSKF